MLKLLRKLLGLSSNPIRGHDHSRIRPVLEFLNYAERCNQLLKKHENCCFIGHGVETLPALMGLKNHGKNRVICDVVETHLYHERSVKRQWPDEVISLLNHATISMLSECDGLISVGDSIGNSLQLYNNSLEVIPNYPVYRTDITPILIKHQLGLADNARIIVAPNLISAGFEHLLSSLMHLPENFHLVTVGSMLPLSYREHIKTLILRLGLTARVHLHGRVPYEDLFNFIAAADVGWIVLDEAIKNHQLSLPNRVFDLISAEVPFLAPPIPDIANICNEYKVGELCCLNDAEKNAELVINIVENKERYVKNFVRAKSNLCWSNIKDRLISVIGDCDEVVFLGLEDLNHNPRTQRFAKFLSETGVHCSIFPCVDDAN